MTNAIPRALTASFAACALSLTLWGGVPARGASPQATPMPTPAATQIPSPMPIVTPAGNPVPTAPSPGTDLLNNNPNGGTWLEKFNRQATPDPGARPPAAQPMMTLPANHPAIPARCRALMKTYANKAITAAQHARLKAECMGKKPM